MKRILIMCASDPQTDPRPNRMIRWLKDQYAVTVLGQKRIKVDGVESIGAPSFVVQGYASRLVRKVLATLGLIFVHLHLSQLAWTLWSNLHAPADRFTSSADLKSKLREKHFDLIISHDLVLLPLAFDVRNNAKVMLDAREFYPRHYEDRPFWRLFKQPMMDYLCAKYLCRCDNMITVSDGIAREYHRRYGVHPSVIMSLPDSHDLSPSRVRNEKIRIIHHGIVSVSRRLEHMIEMMDYVDPRFSLDLMLMPEKSWYWDKLTEMTNRRKNVRFIPPVPMQEVIPFTNRYDLGLFLCEPTTFNLAYALPNKLFEFIQARLAVAIGPSIEMKKIVEKYDCGVVSRDFAPKSMAEALNQLTEDKIMYYKTQSHKASHLLNGETNSKRIRELVRELIGD